jgi:hypothetical protein
MTNDHSKIHELTDNRNDQTQSYPAPGRTEIPGSFPEHEMSAALCDNSEGSTSSQGSVGSPQMALPTVGATSANETPAYGETPLVEEGAIHGEGAQQGETPATKDLELKSGNAIRGGATRLGAGCREISFTESAGASTDSPPKPSEKLAGDVRDSSELSKIWLSNLVPEGGSLDFPPNISSFRDHPERFISEMAEDPLEAMLLSAACHFHGQIGYYISVAGDTRDPAYRRDFLNFAMRLSDQEIKISDAVRRGRRDGRQEVIVKHQDSDGGPVRRPRARRPDPRENTPKVLGAKRSAAT